MLANVEGSGVSGERVFDSRCPDLSVISVRVYTDALAGDQHETKVEQERRTIATVSDEAKRTHARTDSQIG